MLIPRPGFPDILCDSRSVCLIYFTFSSTLWTAAMSHSSSVMVKTLLRGKRVVNLSFRYQTLCWGMPLVIALLAHYFFQVKERISRILPDRYLRFFCYSVFFSCRVSSCTLTSICMYTLMYS